MAEPTPAAAALAKLRALRRRVLRRRALARGSVVLALGALVLAAFTGDLAGFTGLPDPAAVTLVILVVAATLWITEAIPLFATSLLILFLELTWLQTSFRDAGADHPDGLFLAPFFSNVVLLFLGGFVLSAAFRKFLVDERLARWVLRRSGGSPGRLLLAVMLVTALLSMWMSNTATAAMMLGLAVPMLADVPKDDPLRVGLVLGIAFAANLGGLGTPIGTPPNAIVLDQMKQLGVAPSFATWLGLAFPLFLVLLFFAYFVLRAAFRTRVEAITLPDTPPQPWTRRSRLVVAIGALTVLAWLLDGLHPFATGTVALLPVVVFFGFGLLDQSDFRALPWDVLVLAGGGLSLGVAVDRSGLGQAIVGLVPAGELGPFALAAAFAAVAAVLTSLMSNTATANLLVPVVVGLEGAAVEPLLLVVAFACSTVMALPVSTPPNAMAFASGAVRTADMVKTGLVISLVGLALTCTLGLVWWRLFGIG
ncbi:MAG TPA: SLC13 family permease [Polyangiaceae bacterium LLY-WYZ-15_(1-7)]|nr:SLC13 family permease [Polyangiaceae bacterium LLY-WYZ-15_(1-7)]HJL04995.1 SLC13 family permease [Polyangiaceae bacterium LLY-WYZ-15_(1-7)]HJL09345.1 SLC13 family permease [Polyangiaceae bacterium LLY-WYZ-15_(1-7)]HJL24257.1 SLC13 family permease [Polyangiaceae bacterium LLY-WYZ-15_(1-7)]HJL28241.1 SLC13 family permease [Polyangiaceae bacterium LLY-WYZ-15_(1-7)]